MSRVRKTLRQATQLVQSEEFQQFMMNADDFISRRDEENQAKTHISQTMTELGEAAQVLNHSLASTEKTQEGNGRANVNVNVISPVVIAKNHRSWIGLVIALMLIIFSFGYRTVMGDVAPDIMNAIFGIHFWLFSGAFIVFQLWKNSFVMIPDGCQALITRFGKVLKVVESGRHYILNPWNRVGYIVNVVKEYPYNAPIREAPTLDQVNASVDLFLQFRINEPRDFIFSLGGVNGFSEKLQNAISEQTRALIYSQRAEEIYDLVGESTNELLTSLNEQFMPAVEFVNANITHAEPSSQEYRMDLASPEMIRVAKQAYTYQYELDLQKKRDEGDLDRELAGLHETLSGISADIAESEAQIVTAEEKEINKATAYATQLMIEAESEAKANVALFEAQALDIRAMRSAEYPEILAYRFQQEVLERMRQSADKLPQLILMGDEDKQLDYIALAGQMLGRDNTPIFTTESIAKMRQQSAEIKARIEERQLLIDKRINNDLDAAPLTQEVI